MRQLDMKPTVFPESWVDTWNGFKKGDVVKIKGEHGASFRIHWFYGRFVSVFGGSHYNPLLPLAKREGQWRSFLSERITRRTHTTEES